MKKRLGALLCALVMCLALLSPASALEEVCFTSLNNKLLPLPPTPCPSGPEASSTCRLPVRRQRHQRQLRRDLGVSLTQSQSSGTITLTASAASWSLT